MPDALAGAVSLDPKNDVLSGAKSIPDPSVMDPNKGVDTLKRIGRAVTDPATVAKFAVGTALPVAAGAAAGAMTEGTMSEPAAALTRTAVQGIAGAIAPYAQYLTGEAMGEKLPPPEVRDVLHSAAFNAGMAGLGEIAGGSASAVKPEMETAPKTIGQLKQAVRNRGFWKSVGLDDDKITSVLKLPEDEKDVLAQQIMAGRETKQAFQTVADSSRKDFTTRYDAAYGAQKNAAVDAVPVADKLVATLQQGEHVLTPAYSNFLKKKLADLTGIDVKMMNSIDFPNSLSDPKSPYHQVATDMWAQGEMELSTPQKLRDLRTEFRENLPTGATNLDQKAANQLTDTITQTYEKGIRDAGGTSEQIGALRGIDEDYGRFQEMLKTLDPRDEKYGSKVADALFDPMAKNPATGAEFIALAKAAEKGNPGTMDKLREAFTNRALEKSSKGATPINQMEILNTLQKQWGENGSRSVLTGLFGKGSPWADPVTFAKTLGTPVDPRDMSSLSRWLSRASSAPYLLRTAAIVGASGGSMYAMYQHPERIPEILGALVGLGLGAKLMGNLDLAGQRAYVNFRINPTPDSFKNFMRVSGAMIGAGAEMPTPREAPNP